MKAICIKEPHAFEIQERPIPQITDADHVLLKVKCAGICGSDVHIYHGANPFATYPRVWGHEFACEVVEVGSGVTDLEVGDHVIGEPIDYCGKCYACRKGRGNVCEELKVYGVHQDGGCQEYLLMKRNKVHKINKDIPWHVAVLTEPLTIGFQSTSRGRVEEGDLVVVMGSGTIGLTVMMAAKAKGARVLMTDLFDSKLEYARKLGADWVVNVRNEKLEDALAAIGEKPNVILDCVCIKSSLEQAVQLVSAAGRVVELGFGPIASEIPHAVMMKKEVEVVGTRLQAGKFPESIAYIEANADRLADFVTQQYTIDQVPEAFEFCANHPADVRKAIVVMD